MTSQEVLHHAQQRAWERYHIRLKPEVILYYAKRIANNDTGTDLTFFKRLTLDRTIWRIEYKGFPMYAMYNKVYHSIETFLVFREDEVY